MKRTLITATGGLALALALPAIARPPARPERVRAAATAPGEAARIGRARARRAPARPGPADKNDVAALPVAR